MINRVNELWLCGIEEHIAVTGTTEAAKSHTLDDLDAEIFHHRVPLTCRTYWMLKYSTIVSH